MPRSPNDNEKPKPASKLNKSKRARRTSTPRRSNSATTRAKLLAQCPPESRQLIEQLFSLSPLEMLGLVIKLVLGDRVTNEELEVICTWYYNVILYSGIYHD